MDSEIQSVEASASNTELEGKENTTISRAASHVSRVHDSRSISVTKRKDTLDPLENEEQTDNIISSLRCEKSEEVVAKSDAPSTLEEKHQNPFIMPPDSEIFLLRDKERQRKRQERVWQRNLHVHEKTTFSSRVHCRPAAMIHPTKSDVDLRKADKAAAVADDTQFTLAITRDRHVDKESLSEYIAKKREMFLVQYSLGVKRDEMRKLEEIAQAEERKLELAEQFLEEDASLFDDFLKENDKNSVEAIKTAETEAKTNLEKQFEIRKLQMSIVAIKSEISKYEETLKEYKTYKAFLDSITPAELKPDKKAHKGEEDEERASIMSGDSGISTDQSRKDAKAKKDPSALGDGKKPKGLTKPAPARRKSIYQQRVRKLSSAKKHKDTEQAASDTTGTGNDSNDEEEDMELYFKEPQQVLDIYAQLEEQNLSLIQNSQETEETLDEMKQAMRTTRRRMTKETKGLTDQIDKLKKCIKRENEKAKTFQLKAKLFRQREAAPEGQEKQQPINMDAIVREVYRNCIGETNASMSTIHMLTTLENRLEEMFEFIETIPTEKVEAAEKMKEKERRKKMREEKLEEQRIYYEERVRRALERARAAPKRMTGRKLMYRSEPPKMKKFHDDSEERARRKMEEEFKYYFTW